MRILSEEVDRIDITDNDGMLLMEITEDDIRNYSCFQLQIIPALKEKKTDEENRLSEIHDRDNQQE